MRGPLLVIDASTYRGSVAIIDRARVLSERDVQMRGADEERLMPAVAAALESAGIGVSDLAGVVCGEGPGSFTSLRIAASIGKGIASAARLPLHSVSSLLLIVAGALPPARPARYLAILDAMRDDVFVGRVNAASDGGADLEAAFEVVHATAAAQIAEAEGRTMAGPGQALDWSPHARGVARLAANTDALTHVDLTAWEPTYGRLAEAQVQWERKHGRSLSV
jgi:tRNA threonylcarbamoyladenosine biosynthesis protein TsaB